MGDFLVSLKELWYMLFGNGKCQICHTRLKSVPVLQVPNPAGYFGDHYHYHQDCVYSAIAAYPEQYGHRAVDLALDIIEAERTQKRELEGREQHRAERIQKARERLAREN